MHLTSDEAISAHLLRLSHDLVRHPGHGGTWSAGASEVCGYTVEEACGRVSRALLATFSHVFWTPLEQALRARGTWAGERVHRSKSGQAGAVPARVHLLGGDGTDVSSRRIAT